MTNWDDYRFFLAVAREKSVRKAALNLGVSHSTVLRRITIFEETLSVRLFDRMPTGYFTTEAGDDLLRSALEMEEKTTTAMRKIAGRDTELSGKIRVTMPGLLASHLLMPDLAQFRKTYPGIELEINTTYSDADLAKREADVALRVSNDPPEDLFGRRILDVTRAAYVSEDYLQDCSNKKGPSQPSWISWTDTHLSLDWVAKSDFPEAPLGLIVNDPQATLDAVKAGMGMAVLPCFVGDIEPGLYRMPPGSIQIYKSLWVLTHEDLRNTARIRKFISFIADSIMKYTDTIAGMNPRKLPYGQT